MPLGIRPRPKPNPNAIRINSNFPNLPLNNNGDGKNKKQLGMGNVGDTTTLAWLSCDLHMYGKTIIRQGWRQGLPQDKPPIWVFCPLMKKAFPRDRILISDCEKCPHYKGVSHSLRPSSTTPQCGTKDFIHMTKPQKKLPKTTFAKEQLEEEIKLRKQEDKEWRNEEREIFAKKRKSEVA